MRPFSLTLVVAVTGCSYPDFGFVQTDAPLDVDTAVAEDTAEPDTAIDSGTDACACAAHERCVDGTCRPFESCATLHAAKPSLTSGVYTLDPDGAGSIASFATYCEMADDGGGWTLALKADGAKKTFVYDSPLWTNDETLNETATSIDDVEAKLPSFSTMPFTALRLGMLDGARRYIRLEVAGASLRAMFAGGSVTTTAGRAEWMKLLADPRLQTNCEAEGFNLTAVATYSARARLGVFGNNEADCDSPDSYIAFGAGFVMPHMCVGAEPGIVVGNYNPASCGNTASVARATAAFGYVFLR